MREFTYIVESRFISIREIHCSDNLRIVPLDFGLNYVDFICVEPETVRILKQKLHNSLRFAKSLHRTFERYRAADPSRWPGISFDVSLLAHIRENRRLVAEEVWLVPTKGEDSDVIYWMDKRSHVPLLSWVYFPAHAVGTILEADGELGNPYTGIAQLFEEYTDVEVIQATDGE